MFKSDALYCNIAVIRVRAFDNTAAVVGGSQEPPSAQMIDNEDPNAWVARRSADSEAMLPYWDKTDDIVVGQDAIRGRGERYLPKFPLELKEDYTFRLANSKFTNIYRDIVESLAAKPFEEEVSLIEPDATIEEFAEDVDGSGNNLTVFAAAAFFNAINSAVDWIFVDYPSDTENIRTKADEKAAGVRPIWEHVLARNVLEAKSSIIAGEEVWTTIRIWEPGSPNHVRVMQRNGPVATWDLYEEFIDKTTQKKRYQLIKSGVFSIGVIPMVPVMTGRRDGKRYFFYPAMQDAADLQIELYQEESGLKFAKNLAAYPMLAGQGVKPEKDADGKAKAIGIGPGRVLYAPPNGENSSGTWQFIEPGSQSLNFLKDNIKETIAQLRELGRQPLTAQSGNLTVITTAVAAGKARSAVSAWVLNLKNALEEALMLTAMWLKLGIEPEVNVYNDFDQFADNAQDLTTLQAARSAGDISQKTYWYELRRRRVLSPEFDPEAEIEELKNELPGDEELDANGMPIKPGAAGAA